MIAPWVAIALLAAPAIKEGDLVTAEVTSVTDDACYLRVGGREGMLRAIDLAWDRIGVPMEFCKPKQKLKLKVLKLTLDSEKNRLSLGLKQLVPNPWDKAEARFAAGKRLKGKIATRSGYELTVTVAPGVDAFLDVSEQTRFKGKVGDPLEVEVVNVDSLARRLVVRLPDPKKK